MNIVFILLISYIAIIHLTPLFYHLILLFKIDFYNIIIVILRTYILAVAGILNYYNKMQLKIETKNNSGATDIVNIM